MRFIRHFAKSKPRQLEGRLQEEMRKVKAEAATGAPQEADSDGQNSSFQPTESLESVQ